MQGSGHRMSLHHLESESRSGSHTMVADSKDEEPEVFIRDSLTAVVWVGTNNHGRTAEQVTGGIKATVQLVNAAAAPDPGLVHPDGTISHYDVYDHLHLSRLGYTPVCRALHFLLLHR
ncbi:hypothetical protein JEQ12_019436 [Ovis aries]|uniref:Uncharacterized protein n=1 Tax=Ovis aries TaxID=9940 RepID=A0A836D2V0_SHEEP|nr:hypothetical protein JEQ12_019436 [Ovis aries]